VGGGTSGISFAWTNAHRKPPKPYHDLNVAGMKAHAALRDEFGATPWWHGGGSLEWEPESGRAAQRENIEQLLSWGYAAEWIDRNQVHELEPDIDLAVHWRRAGRLFSGGRLARPGGLRSRHAVRRSAASWRQGRLWRARRRSDHARRSRLRCSCRRRNAVHEADMVVNCAGRWTNEVVREAGLHLPLAPTVGFLVFTPPVASQPEPRGSHQRHRRTAGWRRPPDAALEPDRCDYAFRQDALSPSMPEARDMVRRARHVAALDRRRGAGGGAYRHPADPGRSFVRRWVGAANLRLLSRGHAQRRDDVAVSGSVRGGRDGARKVAGGTR
jgi:hypothetical protein